MVSIPKLCVYKSKKKEKNEEKNPHTHLKRNNNIDPDY